MQILFIKLTSMGDLIHALPALTDASNAIPGIRFDWVIDKNFSEVASWHPAVRRIITTQHRHWRRHFYKSWRNGEIKQFLKSLRSEKYDLVIDGQTSTKSGLVTLLSRGPKRGLDKNSASEPWIAPIAYQKSYFVPKELHAIQRLRRLFSMALDYPCPETFPHYGLKNGAFSELKFKLPNPYLIFVHNASWTSKLWPEENWRKLIKWAAQAGYHVVLPWGNATEKFRAESISKGHANAQVLPFCSLSELAKIFQGAAGAISSDTGLSHLAAALNVPNITLYGSTDPSLIGTTGMNQIQLLSDFPCTKCYQYNCHYGNRLNSTPLCLLEIKPELVWEIWTHHSNHTFSRSSPAGHTPSN